MKNLINIRDKSASNKEVKSAKESLKKEFLLNRILGVSKVVQDLKNKLAKISQCDVNVLISGETGTGKELAARAIHYLSNRSGQHFIPVNCGAIPENLFENELFGHVKGAFTDACINQKGLVKEAEGGTLFLDEIGVISPYIQVKLLRLLQDKEYKPLGDATSHKANIRFIAATNMELKDLIKEGKFREDLFYRLNIVSVTIPPLRERIEDTPILVEHFIKQYTKEYHKIINMLSVNGINKLMFHSWPGNIRELENKVQQLIVMASSDTVKTVEIDLPEIKLFTNLDSPKSLNDCKKEVVDSFEKYYLTSLLEKYQGNVVKAAAEAGKSRTGLWNLLRKHNISIKNYPYGNHGSLDFGKISLVLNEWKKLLNLRMGSEDRRKTF